MADIKAPIGNRLFSYKVSFSEEELLSEGSNTEKTFSHLQFCSLQGKLLS